MALTSASTCQYEFERGRRCGSPTLRKMRYCYLHQLDHKRNAKKLAERVRQRWFKSVNLNDRKAVQRALAEILRRLAEGTIDFDRAGGMLFELEAASIRLRAEVLRQGGGI